MVAKKAPTPIAWVQYPPLQEEMDRTTFSHEGHQVTSLARYSLEARVLGVKKYRDDLAPLDFALGWQEMSHPDHYKKLNIKQSHRWYTYSWGQDGPPIPLKDIIVQSANTHIIPKDRDTLRQLKKVKEGDVVKLSGKLVLVSKKENGRTFSWKSSLSRRDSGAGACELFYVEHVEIVGR